MQSLITGLILICASTIPSFAASGSGDPTADKNHEIIELNNSRIDAEQQRIDGFDGKVDGQINFESRSTSEFANEVFIGQLDAIQSMLITSETNAFHKAMFSQSLLVLIQKVDEKSYQRLNYYNLLFSHLLGCLHAMERGNLETYLQKNMSLSFKIISFIKYLPEVDAFLFNASHSYPDDILSSYGDFMEMAYAEEILIETTKQAPDHAKKYLNTRKRINTALRKSTDPDVMKIIELFDRFGFKSRAYSLLDNIQHNISSAEEADRIASDDDLYFKALIDISKRKNILASYTVHKELEALSLKRIRLINDLHDEPDPVRFQSVSNYSSSELYTLIVYTREEIFTSSFNGLYRKWKSRIGSEGGFSFLQSMGFNRFRTFIAACAGYNQLRDLLSTMSKEAQKELLSKFASGLEENGGDLSEAIDVADLLGSLEDPAISSALKTIIDSEFRRLSAIQHKEGMSIYGLLSGMFTDQFTSGSNWLNDVAARYQLPSPTILPIDQLFNNQEACIQQHFFYDDEDGAASFNSFLDEFRSTDWTIKQEAKYVKISSVAGRQVVIYANNPEAEREGQEALARLFDKTGIAPSVIVHRGHSYYAYKTIDRITPATKIVLLGSCGSYHKISTVIDRSPDVQIISSKQIGTMLVNNPLLKIISEKIRMGQDLDWQLIWGDLEEAIDGNEYAMKKFKDYIPPHKNVGSVFLKAYQRSID